jgi:hypothetical protein
VKALTRMNAWINRNADRMGIPVIDFYNQLVDTTTGNWTAGLNSDNFHPNGAGAKVMGQLLSDKLAGTTYIANAGPSNPILPPYIPWLPANSVDTANVVTNALMLTDSGAPSDGRPAGRSSPAHPAPRRSSRTRRCSASTTS